MIVMKFGGTSTEDATAMRNVLRIVRTHQSDHPVLVISAIARATNELEQIARSASLGQQGQAKDLLTSLRRRHEVIVRELITGESARTDLLAAIGRYADAIAARCQVMQAAGLLRPQDMDAVCSFGERLSSRIIAVLLSEHAIPARWVDVCDFMLTDSNFGRARPIAAEAETRVRRVLGSLVNEGIVPVTQGFIGVTRDGEYTTMGRESSDYSATLIGAMLRADRVQIWTDVDGILSADPRVIRNARKIRSLSFDEALHLSVSGAKVLHPTTMIPVIERKIPVQIMNSKKEGNGSLIQPENSGSGGNVKSIAHRKNVLALTVTLKQSSGGAVPSLLGLFSERGITILLADIGLNAVTVVIERLPPDSDLPSLVKKFGSLEVREDLGSITLVGSGIGMDGGIRGT
ncbi:MAG: aspartate kinase, partial [Ignavibacteria bacterium]|nr:aspartate kinase [Ignavibacteria bacterium]